MRTMIAAALLLACAAIPLEAQESGPAYLAAVELLEASGTPATLAAATEATLRQQVEQNPELAELEEVMREFFAIYLSWENLRDAYAELYVRRFTVQEMRAITAFYRTPTGRKLAELSPDLTVEAGQVGERIVQENMAELQEMILRHMMGGD